MAAKWLGYRGLWGSAFLIPSQHSVRSKWSAQESPSGERNVDPAGLDTCPRSGLRRGRRRWRAAPSQAGGAGAEGRSACLIRTRGSRAWQVLSVVAHERLAVAGTMEGRDGTGRPPASGSVVACAREGLRRTGSRGQDGRRRPGARRELAGGARVGL